MEEYPTVGQRIVKSQTEHDRNAEQLQAEAYQHLARRFTNLLPENIKLDPNAIAQITEVPQ